jgi:hypothetical protein
VSYKQATGINTSSRGLSPLLTQVLDCQQPPNSSPKLANHRLLRLSEDTASHVPLAEVVLDGALLGRGRLSEGSGSTEGTSKGSILHADNADVASTTGGARAGHTGRHLDLDGEVLDGGSGKTADTDTGNVLGNGSLLEGSGVGTAGGGVDHGGQGTSAVLVDLVEGHADGTIIGSGRETRRGTGTSGSGNTCLLCALRSRGTTGTTSSFGTTGTTGTASESVEKATLVGGTSTSSGATSSGTGSGTSTGSGSSTSSSTGTSTHEGGDGSSGVNGTATLSAAESRCLAAHLLGTDDGSVGLRAREGVARVAGSTVDDGKTGHVDTVGTLDLSDDTVGRDGAGKGSEEDDGVLHDDYVVGFWFWCFEGR